MKISKSTSLSMRSVIDVIREEKAVSRTRIAILTGLSMPDVMKITASLEEGRMVKTAGKRREMLEFVDDTYFIAGAEVGRRILRVVITTLGGRVVARYTTEAGEDIQTAAGQFAQLVESAVSGIPKLKLLGIGVCLSPDCGWTKDDLPVSRYPFYFVAVNAHHGEFAGDAALSAAAGVFDAFCETGEILTFL